MSRRAETVVSVPVMAFTTTTGESLTVKAADPTRLPVIETTPGVGIELDALDVVALVTGLADWLIALDGSPDWTRAVLQRFSSADRG